MKAKIIPSILEYYGAKENVWDPDESKPDEFLDLMKSILATIFIILIVVPLASLSLLNPSAYFIGFLHIVFQNHHHIAKNLNNINICHDGRSYKWC